MKYNFFIFCIACLVFGCTSKSKTSKLKLETISDSLYHPGNNYMQDLNEWKNYYKKCTGTDLFSDAYYMQLQDKVYIGSINNEHEIDVNKGIRLLDTSKMSDVFNLLYVTNSSNCSDTLHLTNTLNNAFLKEIKTILNASPEHKTVLDLIDTTTMKIRIGTMYSNKLIPERLIKMLDTTKDEALIKYKTMLMNSENVLLAQTVEMFGFSAEFSLKMKPSTEQVKQLANDASFTFNSSSDNAIITLLSNNNIQVRVNKRYTILGNFVQLKAE